MIETFRKHARSGAVQAVAGAISLVFVLSFGPGGAGNCSGDALAAGWAAKVNGEEVPAHVFKSALQQRVQMMGMRGSGSLKVDDLKAAKVREEALKDVVERELIAQEAERIGLWVSDADVAKEIQKIDAFKKDGQFSPKEYERYVQNYLGIKVSAFEERMRRDLLVQRMYQLALDGVTVSDDELKAEYVKSEESASVMYVRFVPSQFRDGVEVSDAEITKVLAERKDEIAKKYESDKLLYMQPRGMKARRVFVPVAADATPEQDAAAKKIADDAQKALAGGKAWDEAVKELPAIEGGGAADLGWVELGRSGLGRTLEEAVFQLKTGATSGLVRDRLGYSVVQIQEERQAQEKALAEVERDIAKDLAREGGAKAAAQKAAADALTAVQSGKSLETLYPRDLPKPGEDAPIPSVQLSQKPQTVVSEELRPYGGFLPGIGNAPKVASTIFSLHGDKRVPDAVVEDQNAFWVIQLISRKRADLAQFDAQKSTIQERLRGQKQAEMRKVWVEALRSKASISENPRMLSYEQPKNPAQSDG